MKIKAFILVLALLALSFAGCSPEEPSAPAQTAAPQQAEEAEPAAPEEDPAGHEEEHGEAVGESVFVEEDFSFESLYTGLMNDLYNFILGSGDAMGWGGEIGIQEALEGEHSEEALQSVGYAFRDLNGDGIPELILGALGEDAYPQNSLFAVYTILRDEPVCLFEGYSRNAFFFMKNGGFLNLGSNGAMYSIMGVYGLAPDGSGLICSDFYFTHEKDENFEDIRVYRNVTGDWDPSVSEETDLSVEDFAQLQSDLEKQIADPELAPISGYAVG